jgi:1,2-diacylglycerol 3-beta-glucosyltransferase
LAPSALGISVLATLVDATLVAAGLPLLAIALYLFALAALSRRPPIPTYPPPRRRFDVIVPAHDEESGVAHTVASLLGVDYPPELRRVLVVADNCTDGTAACAAAAGATVLVRDDPQRRGKGFALAFAYERSLADGFADAVVVVDADTVASPNLLRAFDAQLSRGAGAIQARYGVANASLSWRTRLMAIAFALFNDVRSLGRDRLHLSTGLRGNGMCFATRLLREVPHDAFSIVEDLEYGIRLGESGHRVHYAPDAAVLGQMVSSARASRSQRVRWEGGRLRLARERGPALLVRALRSRNVVLLDLAVDLIVPPLAYVSVACGAGASVAVACSLAMGTALAGLWPWLLASLCLVAYVARGWWVSGMGARGLVDLACAPVFVAWKIAVMLRPAARGAEKGSRQVWVRTAREHPR